MTDFAIGMFLVFFLPVVCYFLSGIVMTGGAQSSIQEREKPEVDPDPDSDELFARLKAGEELLRLNAKTILAQAESIQDSYMKDQFRRWAKRSLETSEKYFTKLTETIRGYPDLGSKVAPHLERIAMLQKEVKAELARAEKIDFFGSPR